MLFKMTYKANVIRNYICSFTSTHPIVAAPSVI